MQLPLNTQLKSFFNEDISLSIKEKYIHGEGRKIFVHLTLDNSLYDFSVSKNTVSSYWIQRFIYAFSTDKKIRPNFKNNKTLVFNRKSTLPYLPSLNYLQKDIYKTFLTQKIKLINNSNKKLSKSLNQLLSGHDEYSYLNMDQLFNATKLKPNENEKIKEYSQDEQKYILRWILRGLSFEKAILKNTINSDKRHYFLEKNFYKKTKERYRKKAI